ncbi:PaaI family thioesterase [Roseibium sp. RKSG952]|uniref:PaaI family thioesterase n=1 Tax=Roseibium sp. RKSG952 TaxID=2529384 RepID=UPI0012BD1475|nr:PaaI family thioesterase [Roseibium sp. RKSG952]MTH94714.1 PaaI family thioesterase [Roseibium sp. RKSG952]
MPTIKIATRHYDYSNQAPNLAAALSLPGLEYLNAAISDPDGPRPSMAATMNFALPHILTKGHAELEAEPADFLLNLLGSVHGGFAATVMDTVLGAAVHTVLPPATGYATAELKVNFTRSIFQNTGRLLAVADVVHAGRKMITVEGRLTGIKGGKLYAHGSATCFVMPLV